MIVELDVPRGRELLLFAGEISPNPTRWSGIVWAVAVYGHAADGQVALQAHRCNPDGECRKGWCFEAHVTVDAIRANLAGAR